MLMWLSANLINLALSAVLALAVGLAIRGMIRDKKAGKSSCGCDCATCGACGGCNACKNGCATKDAAKQDRSDSARADLT